MLINSEMIIARAMQYGKLGWQETDDRLFQPELVLYLLWAR